MRPRSLSLVPAVDTADPGASPEAEALAVLRRLLAPSPHAPLDELRPLRWFADAWGLEVRGLRRLAASGALPVVEVGRSTCARVSDVLALVERQPARSAKPTAGPPSPADAYAAELAAPRRRAAGR